MNWRDLVLRARALVRPWRVERDLQDELASHLDLETRKLERAGLPAADARREALKRFGPPALAADRIREEQRVTAVTDMLADLRFAVRQFRRRPLSSLIMIIVLALGIGFSSSLFILQSSIESSPPAGVERDEFRVRIRGIDGSRGPGRAIGREFPFAEYRAYAAASQTFESVAAWTSSDAVIDVAQGSDGQRPVGGSNSQLISGAATYVTDAYGGSGLLALALAAIGLYGVISVTAAQRVREIGIRTALGADRRRIVRVFVARGLQLSLAGLSIGLALGVVAARGIAAVEGDTPPSGLLPLSIGVAVFVMAVALAASWIPARRAAAVGPLIALRD